MHEIPGMKKSMAPERSDIINRMERTIKVLKIISYVFFIIGAVGVISFAAGKFQISSTNKTLNGPNYISTDSVSVRSQVEDSKKAILKETDISKTVRDSVQETTLSSLHPPSGTTILWQDYQVKTIIEPLELRYPIDTLFIVGTNGAMARRINTKNGTTIRFENSYNDLNLIDFKENNILVKWLFVDNEGNYFGHIYNNVIFLKESYPFRIAVDSNSVEVIDKNGLILFGLVRLDGHTVFVQGYISEASGVWVFGPGGSKVLGLNPSKDDLYKAESLVCNGPIFKYEGNNKVLINASRRDSSIPKIRLIINPTEKKPF